MVSLAIFPENRLISSSKLLKPSPRASVVMSAGAVDAMLKARGLTEGSLYTRIGEAVTSTLLTKEMAEWAHDVRLDANDQRHADVKAIPPTTEDAKRCLEFAKALADILAPAG
jgi:Domain of unknown function (DUF4145)